MAHADVHLAVTALQSCAFRQRPREYPCWKRGGGGDVHERTGRWPADVISERNAREQEQEQIDHQAQQEHLVHEAERVHAEEAAELGQPVAKKRPCVEILGTGLSR